METCRPHALQPARCLLCLLLSAFYQAGDRRFARRRAPSAPKFSPASDPPAIDQSAVPDSTEYGTKHDHWSSMRRARIPIYPHVSAADCRFWGMATGSPPAGPGRQPIGCGSYG